jgi:amidase
LDELMNRELHYLELLEVAELLRKREITSVEVTKAQLERIAKLDSSLASYALVCEDEALNSASVADTEIAAGNYRGPLHGVPLGIKDLFFTKDISTSGGMPIYHGFRPHPDATVIARLRSAGAVTGAEI